VGSRSLGEKVDRPFGTDRVCRNHWQKPVGDCCETRSATHMGRVIRNMGTDETESAMRTISLINSLFLIFSLLQSTGNPATAKVDNYNAAARPESVESSPALAGMSVSLTAATNATILFKAENGQESTAPQQEGRKIPYLVLSRNGAPTPRAERSLHISLDNLQVPPSGLYAALEIETQHNDPDRGEKNTGKIIVWKEKRFVSQSADPQMARTVDFQLTFPPMIEYQGKTIQTPTDYFNYRLTFWDAEGKLLRAIEQSYAFLLENQVRVPLPKVLEAAPGAAPRQLVVYFCDMIPFQSSFRDPETRIPRKDVEQYVQAELIPAMVEAFRVQTDVWNLPWYTEWKNFRSEEDPKTLSVALDEYGTWFHGAAPSLGHAMISIRVDGSFGEYDSITEGIMSVFHHELFHNQQRNISQHFGAKGNISGKDGAWEIFSEGTAVLASLVGQPAIQMAASALPRSYLKRANAFIGAEGVFPGGLNLSYTRMPYQTALYWRYLYEQCGGIQYGVEDPAAGMQVIRHVLETLYSGQIVDINSSTATVANFPKILDVALYRTSSCPFHNYEESLVRFTRAIYELRHSDGRCKDSIASPACGFFDPNKLYSAPNEENHTIVVAGRTNINGSIRSSFGVDLVKLSAGSELDGKSIRILFKNAAGTDYNYNVELWAHQEHRIDDHQPIVSKQTQPGVPVIEVDKLDLENFQSLDLVITRLDTNEDVNQPGQYTIEVIVR
jgi:hypothetical protein